MADKKLFRKKPVVIEAIQWDGTLAGIDDIISVFPDIRTVAKTAHPSTNKCSFWKIGTLEGSHEVSAGDFIIRGVKGEYYPCKPDIFFMTYEPATATPPADAALADALEHAGTRAEFHPDSEIAVLCRKAAAALRAREVPAVPDDVAKDAEVGAAIQRACRDLPEGFTIHIDLECGAGSVEMMWEDERWEPDFDLSFAGQINECVDEAIRSSDEDAAILSAKEKGQ